MNQKELSAFLLGVGVELSPCRVGRFKWMTKPIDGELPIDRFVSLAHATRFWRSMGIERLRDLYQVEQVIAGLEPLTESNYASIMAWLDKDDAPYPPCFRASAAKMKPFVTPKNWRKALIDLAKVRGGFYGPWLRGLHRRTMEARGYTPSFFAAGVMASS